MGSIFIYDNFVHIMQVIAYTEPNHIIHIVKQKLAMGSELLL